MVDGGSAQAMLRAGRGRALCQHIVFIDRDPDDLDPTSGTGAGSRFLMSADEHELLAELASVVAQANYWDRRRDPSTPPIEDQRETELLLPVADAILSCPAAQWWLTPLERSTQHLVHHLFFPDEAAPTPDEVRDGDLRLVMASERQDEESHTARGELFPSQGRQPSSGVWWSHPRGAWETTRSIGSLPAVDLVCVEDTFGPTEALYWPVTIDPGARIYEINGVEDWQNLTVRYPRDVTHTRRNYWWAQTGWEGRWIVPDWLAVAEDYDGVHLTVNGDLTVTGWPIPVDHARSFLAGWTPDQTYWLNNVIGMQVTAGSWDGEADEPATWTITHRPGPPVSASQPPAGR